MILDHEAHTLAGPYVLDAVDDLERARFERHLDSCRDCREEVFDLTAAAIELSLLTVQEPPPALRDRVMAEITAVRPLPPLTATPMRPRRRRRARWLPAVAAAALIAGAGGAAVSQPWERPSSPVVAVADQVRQAPDAQRVSVELSDGARATVIRSASVGRAILVTRDLPAPPSQRVYQLWLKNRAGTFVSAGLIPPTTGPVTQERTVLLDGDARDAQAAGITVEPAGGSVAPTSDPIALFPL